MLLMVIILVPINLAINMLHVGKMEVNVRGATQEVIDRMRDDLKRAIYVFPNDTDSHPPYNGYPPYFTGDPCNLDRVSNLSRIDLLLPDTNDHDGVYAPVIPSYYIVTYYARRLDTSKDYQPITNPIVLFRAQIPFRGSPDCPACLIDGNGTAVQPSTSGELYPSNKSLNANVFTGRYNHLADCGTANAAAVNRSAEWLTQSATGEPNLEPLTQGTADAFKLYGSHTNLLSSGMGLSTRIPYRNSVASYERPDTSFICKDTDGDGLIDQVTVKLAVYLVDSEQAYTAKEFTLSQVMEVSTQNLKNAPTDIR
jgi:hypothetical protein